MKQKTRFLIYILVAVAFVILGSIAIINNHQADKPASVQEHIDLGRIYLNDLSYEKAVLEFTEAINIEPLNADAYLGLAEAYIGIGDTDKAIEILEEGYDKTGDERLKDMLEELQPPVPEETTAVTTAETIITTTEETTTVSTAAMATVPDLSGLTEAEAVAACEAAGLKYSVSYDYSDEVEEGYVVNQIISADSSVAEGISVPFTVSEGGKVVTTVTTTPAPAEEFITIKGVQYSTLLTELNLERMELTNEDIKDLNKMTSLVDLNLHYNNISDISVLINLTNLERLTLSYNQISDINALKNLSNLSVLVLGGNPINDISVLKNFSKLTELYLYGMNSRYNVERISDISVLKDLSNLTILHLGGQEISDISALENLTNLTALNLTYNPVRNIDPLKKNN